MFNYLLVNCQEIHKNIEVLPTGNQYLQYPAMSSVIIVATTEVGSSFTATTAKHHRTDHQDNHTMDVPLPHMCNICWCFLFYHSLCTHWNMSMFTTFVAVAVIGFGFRTIRLDVTSFFAVIAGA